MNATTHPADTASRLPPRLRSKVQIDLDGCWIWTASLRGGYGQVRAGASVRQAHRVIYEILVGEVPEGLDLDHLCRDRRCVNPEHLEPVDRRTNLMRGHTIAAENARKTTCPKGHHLVPNARGTQRHCLICRREQRAARKGLNGGKSMATKIGTQTGIVAAKQALTALDGAHSTAYANLAATQQTLVDGHNEYQDRISSLEARLSALPFGAASS